MATLMTLRLLNEYDSHVGGLGCCAAHLGSKLRSTPARRLVSLKHLQHCLVCRQDGGLGCVWPGGPLHRQDVSVEMMEAALTSLDHLGALLQDGKLRFVLMTSFGARGCAVGSAASHLVSCSGW